jgi:hypothetical protein
MSFTKHLSTVKDMKGFSLCERDSVVARVNWADVVQITAYKADLLTCDTVAIRFDIEATSRPITITEEVKGFEAIRNELAAAFPTIEPMWYDRVLQPPFAANETILFKRQGNET